MAESPWRAYFGQINKTSSSRKGRARHPVVVALTVISIISLITAALVLRVHRWYYGEISVLPLCNDNAYKQNHGRAILPVSDSLAYSLSLAVPPVIVLCVEFMYLLISLDGDEKSEGDDDEVKPRLAKGLYLFLFRFLHFTAALILTAAFVSIIVDIAKIVFNWPRPYFLKEFPNNCNPSMNDPRRTPSQKEIDARLGFPSYRVALLSGAAVLLSVHSTRTLRAMRSSGPFQTLIVFVSFLVPILAAASVLNSHENRSEDVIVGLLIGVISGTYMISMLPTKLVWGDVGTKTSKSTPSTIEELNSFVPMRQLPLSAYNGLERPRSLQRHSALPESNNQPVPLPGLTSSGGGLMRTNM